MRCPRTATIAAFSLCAGLFSLAPGRADTTLATFLPTRPSHVQVKSASGVLTDYGRGTQFGGFDLRDDSTGVIDRFATARRMRIGGAYVACSDPPQPGYDHFAPGPACPDWPRTVVIGRTHVVVTYWKTVDPQGRATLVSDVISPKN